MKTTLSTFFLIFNLLVSSQQMTVEKLGNIINEVSDTVEGDDGRWQFQIDETIFIVLTDATHNRMRIISPISKTVTIKDDMLKNALIANFHSALDVKYAISEGVLWSAYIHPLKELSEAQVKDAISQVYYANVNFGTTYASTSLIFPGSEQKDEKKPSDKKKTNTRKI